MKPDLRCPCGSQLSALQCCHPYLAGEALPLTPEALMRSRYTAYSTANIPYIIKTMRGKALQGFDENNASRWAKRVIWLGLKVLTTNNVTLDHGMVEFEATFVNRKTLQCIHEKSEFARVQGQWYYTEGIQLLPTHPLANQIITQQTPCPCGSQRKFKSCHGPR